MQSIDAQTLKDLEFTMIQSWLAEYAIGPTASNRLSNLLPITDFKIIVVELTKVKELLNIRMSGDQFPALTFEELDAELRLLPIIDAVLSQEGFVRIYFASQLVNQLVLFFDKNSLEYPNLSKLFEGVYFTNALTEAIESVFDKKGSVKDDASPALFLIRKNIQQLRGQIHRNFERELRKLMKDGVLGDTKETFINERRVLTVLSTYKRKVPGSVIGSSKTGSLTYIEPQVNILLTNELELLIDDERKEIFKILKLLTADIAQYTILIQYYQSVLTELDFLYAKMRLALQLKADLPIISEEPCIELINAFHPILWKNNQEQGKKTFPQSLLMDKFSRMLVISGPNAGGKSITLKTIGLLQLMLQSGLLIPVHPSSHMSVFKGILTDIGDNQSIQNELSTYSYRLKRMKYFLDVANKNTLLLLDEFGTGSDPDLGGALAEVFFENLYNKKSFGVITTHYSSIKLKADRLKNAINGCMLFNTETLEPLYRFSTGHPGSSFTFEVAQMNGISMDLINDAKGRVNDHKMNMDRLLSELQREKNYLETLNKEHIEAQIIAEKARLYHDEAKARYEAKFKSLQDLTQTTNTFILYGKKVDGFVSKFITRSKKKDVNQVLIEDIKKFLMVEKTKREEVIRIDQLKKDLNSPLLNKSKKKGPLVKQNLHFQDKIKVGSCVKLIETKQSGIVDKMEGSMCTVIFGFMSVIVDKSKLTWIS